MVRRCLQEQTGFGVALILEGEEAGAAARVAATGTRRAAGGLHPLPDGLLGITCLGEERFRIAAPLAAAGRPESRRKCEYLAPPLATGCRRSSRTWPICCARCCPSSDAAYAHVDAHYEDAGWVANRWAEVLPLEAAEKLQLLELDEPLARLAQVAAAGQPGSPRLRMNSPRYLRRT